MTLPAVSSPDANPIRNALAPCAFGAFRILFGLLFLMHGTAKLFGFPHGDPVEFLAWPYWWAGTIEIVVGVLITIGLRTRAAAFVGAGTMAVAYFWYFFPDGFWPSVNGGELSVIYCFILVMMIFTGPGALAVRRR